MKTSPDIVPCPLCGAPGQFSFMGRDFMFNGQADYPYGCCQACEIDYQSPQPSLQQIADFYPKDYDKHGALEAPRALSWSRRLVYHYRYGFKHLPANAGLAFLAPVLALFKYRNTIAYTAAGKVLDVGCGNGKFLQSLQQMGWQACGVDFNENAVAACQAAGLEVKQGTIEAAGFAPGAFDLVTARHVIEHVPDPITFIQEIAQVTKSGGQVLIRTPNNNALGKKYFHEYWFPNEVPRHLMLFSPKSIDALLGQHGFKKITLKTLTSPRFVLKSLDYKRDNQGKSYRKSFVYRLIGQVYALVARVLKQGDEIYALYQKV